MKKPDYLSAVSELTDEGFGWNYDEDRLEWTKTNTGVAPTRSEIDAKLTELTEKWNAQAYARARRLLYPYIGDQLDDLYHKGAFSADMAAKIKKDKDDNPKG